MGDLCQKCMLDFAGAARASLDSSNGLPALRLRKTSSFQKQQTGAVMWNPALEPPRPSHADELTKVEELPSPRDENMPSFTYSSRGEAPRPDLSGGVGGPSSSADSAFLPPELQNAPAIQQAHAARVQMSVNNCHMLQYRATRLKNNASSLESKDMELIPVPAAKSPPKPAEGGGNKASFLTKKSTMRVIKPVNKVQPAQPALVTITAGDLALTVAQGKT